MNNIFFNKNTNVQLDRSQQKRNLLLSDGSSLRDNPNSACEHLKDALRSDMAEATWYLQFYVLILLYVCSLKNSFAFYVTVARPSFS